MSDYQLLDSGKGEKLEKFGPYILRRPCSQALWNPEKSEAFWEQAHASFSRDQDTGWSYRETLPHQWLIEHLGLKFQIEPTSFGHLGLFPEHSRLWDWLKLQLEDSNDISALNLFGYTGATSLFLAKHGAKVCHLDASKKMVDKARQNAALNNLQECPVRWIVDDVFKFLKREIKRERFYDGIILDPPSFGRGTRGEVFKFEDDLPQLMQLVSCVLSKNPKFVLLTCHTLGVTPIVLKNMLQEHFKEAHIEVGELTLSSQHHELPKGIYAKCVFR